MIKKMMALLLSTVILVTALTACGAPDKKPAEKGGKETPGKILYFVIGNLGDLSYGDMGWWATQAVAEEYGYEYEVVEGGADPANYTTSLLDAIETGGYTHVITAGWYIVDDILRLAGTDYKDIQFILFDTGNDIDLEGLDNVYCITYKANEASFVTAVYLAMMSQTGKIGAISCNDSPLLNDFITGVVQGAKYCKEELGMDITSLVTYIGAQTIQNNYETASVLYDQGIDAIFNIGSTTALGACQAAEERGGYETGHIIVGVDCDQYEVYKNTEGTDVTGYENIATSMLKRIEESCLWVFAGMADGSIKPGLHRVGIAEDGVGLAKNEHYYELTPQDVQKKVEEIEAKIANGEIKVKSYYDFKSYEEFAEYRDN